MHISRIYNCVKIETPSELYYIAELARYLAKKGETLSIEGVEIPKEYESCLYWSYLRKANVVGVPPLKKDVDLKSIEVGDFSEIEVEFLSKTDTEWVYDYDLRGESPQNTLIFKGLKMSLKFLSFVAYITIERITTGTPKLLTFDLVRKNVCTLSNYTNWQVLDLYLVYRKTSALDSWVELKLATEKYIISHLDYEAYAYEIKLLGGMQNYIPPEVKYKAVKKNFQQGDIVFLYKKADKGNASDSVKSIDNCFIAKFLGCDLRRGVVFEKYMFNATPLTIEKKISAMPEKVQRLYDEDYSTKNNKENFGLSWDNVGVNEFIFLEEYFFTDLDCNDSSEVWFVNNSGEEVCEVLPCADAVYAVLCERGIDFNKERYAELYFKNKPSKYEVLKAQ